MELTFLGTGGGRFTTIKQLRRTGGMHLTHDGHRTHIDPGPGALVHARKERIPLEDLDTLIVTHAHFDHCNDMNAVIEAMTGGGKTERGTVYVSRSVLEGAAIPERYTEGKGVYGGRIDPVLDGFHRSLPAAVEPCEAGDTFEEGPFTMACTGTEHSDPTTFAFSLETGRRRYGFVTDTELTDDLVDFFADCAVLVVNLMRPHDREWKGHCNTADAADLLNTVEPDFAVMQHFGAALLYGSVNKEQAWLKDETDVDFVMAEDGMTLDLEQPKQGLERFMD